MRMIVYYKIQSAFQFINNIILYNKHYTLIILNTNVKGIMYILILIHFFYKIIHNNMILDNLYI